MPLLNLGLGAWVARRLRLDVGVANDQREVVCSAVRSQRRRISGTGQLEFRQISASPLERKTFPVSRVVPD
jgi:hypothetical protein